MYPASHKNNIASRKMLCFMSIQPLAVFLMTCRIFFSIVSNGKENATLECLQIKQKIEGAHIFSRNIFVCVELKIYTSLYMLEMTGQIITST